MDKITELDWDKLEAFTISQLNTTSEQFQNEKKAIAEHNSWLKNDQYEWKCSTVYGLLENSIKVNLPESKADEKSWVIDGVSEIWVQGKVTTLAAAQQYADNLAKQYM